MLSSQLETVIEILILVYEEMFGFFFDILVDIIGK